MCFREPTPKPRPMVPVQRPNKQNVGPRPVISYPVRKYTIRPAQFPAIRPARPMAMYFPAPDLTIAQLNRQQTGPNFSDPRTFALADNFLDKGPRHTYAVNTPEKTPVKVRAVPVRKPIAQPARVTLPPQAVVAQYSRARPALNVTSERAADFAKGKNYGFPTKQMQMPGRSKALQPASLPR